MADLWALLAGCFQGPFPKRCQDRYRCRTLIGGVNAAIIAGSKNEKQPEQLLEQFWLELADSFIDLDNIRLSSLIPILGKLTANHYYFSPSTSQQNKIESKRKMEEYRNRFIRILLQLGMFGNDKMFIARWRPEYALTDPEYFEPAMQISFSTCCSPFN